MMVSYRGQQCRPIFSLYAEGQRTRLDLVSAVEPIAHATINTPHELERDEAVVAISSQDVLLSALVHAGLVEDLGRRLSVGPDLAPVVRWTPAAIQERSLQLSEDDDGSSYG